FWMLLRHAPGRPYDPPRQRIAGALSLRVGHSQATELYYGHIGYSVYPPARGHRYALRAARLVLPLARAHGLRFIWLTCNPDNAPSRRTIELLGGRYVNTIPVPPGEPLYERGEVRKSRFKLELG
ncbi:MAG TPA: GNAT family N-acetyltransferase, partial [Humisphaera sp.]